MTTECLEKSGLVSPTEVTRAVRKGEETPETVTETHRESLESKVRGNGFPLDVFWGGGYEGKGSLLGVRDGTRVRRGFRGFFLKWWNGRQRHSRCERWGPFQRGLETKAGWREGSQKKQRCVLGCQCEKLEKKEIYENPQATEDRLEQGTFLSTFLGRRDELVQKQWPQTGNYMLTDLRWVALKPQLYLTYHWTALESNNEGKEYAASPGARTWGSPAGRQKQRMCSYSPGTWGKQGVISPQLQVSLA